MGLFGQILAALYQNDVVEEDDIRAWHGMPASRGGEGPDESASAAQENMLKCWLVGKKMIEQFDEQEDSDSDEDEGGHHGEGSEESEEDEDGTDGDDESE